MAIKHIFPNVNRYCDGSGIRTGFKILVVLLIVFNLFLIYEDIGVSDLIHIILTIIILIPFMLFLINLFKPNRGFLNFFRFFMLIYIIFVVVQGIMAIVFKKNSKAGFGIILYYVFILLIKIYMYLAFGAYSEQLIDELDDINDKRGLEEN